MADSSQILEVPATVAIDPVTPQNTVHPPVQQTPVVHKAATNRFSMDEPTLTKAYLSVAKETKGHYMVGIKPDDFLNQFLPWNASTPKSYENEVPDEQRLSHLLSVPPKKGKAEASMYKPFVKALNGWVTGTDNKQALVFRNYSKSDKSCARMNVDISSYWKKELPKKSSLFSHQQTHEEFKSDPGQDAFRHHLDEGPGTTTIEEEEEVESDEEDTESENSFEEDSDDSEKKDESEDETEEKVGDQFKTEEEDDGLPVLHANVEANTQSGNRTRGQIAAYAGVALSMAFRTHFFSMLILGKYARFIRWDRRGAIVTHRFDYTQHHELMFGFYKRYGQLTRKQRGFDLSAEPWKGALPENVCEAFDSYYQRSWHNGSKFNHRTGEDETVVPAAKQRFFVLTVKDNHDPDSNKEEKFFVPAPAYRRAHISPFSRASRRCLAYFNSEDKDQRQMCFLKDSWQEVTSRSAPEADIYRRLHAQGVRHIASMRLGGDVDDLITVTQDWFHVLSHNGRFKKLGHMVCHRIILDTVARDLSTFGWCKVLLSCIADAMEGAQEAYKAGVLHRDISAGNIMIVRDHETQEWRGILIDWDMCLLWEERSKLVGEVRTGRTGTWAFIAARILMANGSGPIVVHSLWDDMESFFWVLVYQALRYLRHDVGPARLFKRMQALFIDPVEENGVLTGGDQKELILQASSMKTSRRNVANFNVVGLNDLLENIGRLLYTRYATPPENPAHDLNNPDVKWFPDLLRSAADTLPPLQITRTALKSDTNDSQPAADKTLWKPASVTETPLDFCRMPWSAHPEDSTLAQERHFQSITSTVMNFVDGLPVNHGSKRAHDHIDDTPAPNQIVNQQPVVVVKQEPVEHSIKRARRA